MTKNYQDDTLRIFGLNANRPLAERIAASVGTELGRGTVRRFNDGETQASIEESTRGDHVYITQATNAPVNDHLMKLLILIDALKRVSVKTANAVSPYYGYARQDRIVKPRKPITTKLVANMLVEAGATRLLTLDLHIVQVQRFFDIPVNNLFIIPLSAHYYRQQALAGGEIVIVLSKNSGARHTCSLSKYLGVALTIADHEEIDGVCQEGYVIGNVAGKKCTLVDDILSVGQALAIAVEVLTKNGVREVYACTSHGLLSEDAKVTLENVLIKETNIADSVYMTANRQPTTLNVISCAELMGEALFHIRENKPMSPLFCLEPKGK